MRTSIYNYEGCLYEDDFKHVPLGPGQVLSFTSPQRFLVTCDCRVIDAYEPEKKALFILLCKFPADVCRVIKTLTMPYEISRLFWPSDVLVYAIVLGALVCVCIRDIGMARCSKSWDSKGIRRLGSPHNAQFRQTQNTSHKSNLAQTWYHPRPFQTSHL